MNGRKSSNSNTPLYNDKEKEFNKFNDFFLSHKTSIPMGLEPKEDRVVLVEADSKDNLKNSTSKKNEKSKELSSYKHLVLGLMVGICSYWALNDSRISIAFSAIAAISSWLIFSEKVLHDGRFFNHHILTVPQDTPKLSRENYDRDRYINPTLS